MGPNMVSSNKVNPYTSIPHNLTSISVYYFRIKQFFFYLTGKEKQFACLCLSDGSLNGLKSSLRGLDNEKYV